MPLLGEGSGFLVLDAVAGGSNPAQLFGPTDGDGFADLAAYDSDANGWIDEADPVFSRLGVWTPDAEGGGAVPSLAAAGRRGALGGNDRVAALCAQRTAPSWGGPPGSASICARPAARATLQQVDGWSDQVRCAAGSLGHRRAARRVVEEQDAGLCPGRPRGRCFVAGPPPSGRSRTC